MKKVEKPKKPLIFYYLIALIILVLLNTFLFPNILGKNKVKEVDYGTFLTMLKCCRIQQNFKNKLQKYF